jgi:Ala-tRNA(Pro) deacylase
MEESIKFLQDLGIAYELVEHNAVYAIEEAEAEPALIGRTEVKNLFIQDDKGKRQYLVMMPGHKKLDMKVLATDLGEKKIRFCSAEKVEGMLGVKPGSVSLFCCLNSNSHHVKIILDKDLLKLPELGMHPIVNTATVFIDPKDVHKILDRLEQDYKVIEL